MPAIIEWPEPVVEPTPEWWQETDYAEALPQYYEDPWAEIWRQPPGIPPPQVPYTPTQLYRPGTRMPKGGEWLTTPFWQWPAWGQLPQWATWPLPTPPQPPTPTMPTGRWAPPAPTEVRPEPTTLEEALAKESQYITAYPELPSDFEELSPQEQYSYLEGAEAKSVIYDPKTGEVIHPSDRWQAMDNPEREVTVTYIVGPDTYQDYTMSIKDALGLTDEEIANLAATREKTGPTIEEQEAKEVSLVDEAIEKIRDLLKARPPDLYWQLEQVEDPLREFYREQRYAPDKQANPAVWASYAVWAALPSGVKEQYQAVREAPAPGERTHPWQPGYIPPEPPEAVPDVAGLRAALAPHGISILDVAPYFTPISQAALSRLPYELIQRMVEYLQSKGMSWQDYLTISSGYFGGGRAPAGRWIPPRQWG